MEISSPEEQARLQALRAYQILDTPPEPVFDRLAQLAAQICHTPIAAISIIDEQRQWFKTMLGLDIAETKRAIAFCSHTIRGTAPFIVADAQADPLFNQNPLVTGAPHLRFYAGFPLITPDKLALGALAVMDTVARELDEAQISALTMLAEQVMVHIELRRQRRELEGVARERDEMVLALWRQTQHLQEAQRIAQIGSWELDVATRTFLLSEEACRLLGIPVCHESKPVSTFLERVHADDRQHVEAMFEEAIRLGHARDVEYRFTTSDGELRIIHGGVHASVNGHPAQTVYGTVQDVTAQHAVQERLLLLDASISRVNEIVMITEAEPHEEPGPRIVFVNQAFEKITGYTPAEVLGRSPRLLQGPKTDRAALARIRAAMERREPVLVEVINYTKSGEEFWQELQIAPVSQEDGRITHFVSVQRDITHRKRNEAQIERLAFYDALTHLPNRRLLLDRLHQAFAIIRRGHHMGALFFIDLDNFKTLNDTLGHDKGDVLLRQVAKRLEACVRSSNTVARLGGDEFVIMLEDLHAAPADAAAQAEVVGEKILAAFAQPFELGGSQYHCTASIGITLFDSELRQVDDLLQRADIAMYQAKTSGRNALRFFDPQMQALVSSRVELEQEMRRGLQQNEFMLYYQPQTDLLGQMRGVEALLRWRHPEHGLVYPATFIALAEDSGLILQLGGWVLEQACRQAAAWARQSHRPPLSVAVNISARQFRQPDFVDQVVATLERTGANPHDLKLELTESILVHDVEGTIAKMEALKNRGVRFSLDDFGTGYSSLSYLKRLPLDQLKIDQAFVKDVLTDPNDAAIARTIVALGQTLGLEVIAEGVETSDQCNFLAKNGCHAYQGFYFGQALPAERI